MLNLVGGFNFSNTESTRNGYKAIGFTEDQFGAPSFANGYPDGGKPSYSESTTRAASFYLNGGYAYDNRYLLDVNYRRDGASMFGSSHRFRDTWSVGIGWNIHKEKFMSGTDLFNCSSCVRLSAIPVIRTFPLIRLSRLINSMDG